MTVTRTELLEAEPLPLITPMRRRLVRAGVVAGVLTVLGFLGGRSTWSVWLFAIAMWLVYAGYVWIDSLAFLQAKGTVLKVRTYFRMKEVNAADVVRVKHQFNGRRPDFQLFTRSGKAVWVPTSKMEGGMATLFAWVGWFVPEATYDKKSEIYRGILLEDKAI